MDVEDRALHLALVLIGGPTLVVDLARGGALGAGATVASVMLITGTAALVRDWLRKPRIPAARARCQRASRG